MQMTYKQKKYSCLAIIILFPAWIWPSIATQIMEQNLVVCPYQEPPSLSPDARLKDYLMFTADQQKHLQEHQRRSIAFNMLDRWLLQGNTNDSCMDSQTFKDVSLFVGQKNPAHYVADIVDRTDTIFGKVNLSHMLATPTTDLELWHQKQKIVQELLHHQDWFDEIKKQLLQIKSVENELLAFWTHVPASQFLLQYPETKELTIDYKNKKIALS